MTLFGLPLPRLSHRESVWNVLASLGLLLGFALGGWLTGTPLDREGAAGLFVGFLYILSVDPFLAMADERMKRFAVAASGAGLLIGAAALWQA